MKIIVPYVYNWEAQIEQKLMDMENKSISEQTNEILDIMQNMANHIYEGFKYYGDVINKLDNRIDQLEQKIVNIENDVKINCKLIDAIDKRLTKVERDVAANRKLIDAIKFVDSQ